MSDACRIVFQSEHERSQVLDECSGEREITPAAAGKRPYLLKASDLTFVILEQATTLHNRAGISCEAAVGLEESYRCCYIEDSLIIVGELKDRSAHGGGNFPLVTRGCCCC